MATRVIFAISMTLASVGQLQAQTPCPLTYEVFEHAVPHLDLETCPTDLARKGAFCRASAGGDAVHVFVFGEEGDRCLLASKSYATGQYELSLK